MPAHNGTTAPSALDPLLDALTLYVEVIAQRRAFEILRDIHKIDVSVDRLVTLQGETRATLRAVLAEALRG